MRYVMILALATADFGAVGLPARASEATALSERRADPSDHFTPAEIERSRAYSTPRYPRAIALLLLGLVVTAALAFGPGARILADRATVATGGRAWLAGALVGIAVVLVGSFVALPFRVLAYRHDRAFGLSTQSLADFLLDRAKGAGFQAVLAAIVGAGLIALARSLPNAWPIAAATGAAALTVALVVVFPLVYEPAFNRFRAAPADVTQRVEALALASGVEIGDVLVVDASRRTTRHNAYVSGLGPTRRVVLYDTLLAGAPAAEVDLVVAHELAHVRHRDVAAGTLLGIIGAILGIAAFWFVLRAANVSASSPRAVAIAALVFTVGSLVTSPLGSAFSRHLEARADRSAVEVVAQQRGDLAGTIDTAIDLEVRLARTNLADLSPPRWYVWAFASHPPVLDRIAAARSQGVR